MEEIIKMLENAKDTIIDFRDLENTPYASEEEIDEVIKYIEKQSKLLELYREYATNKMNKHWQNKIGLVNKGREDKEILEEIKELENESK